MMLNFQGKTALITGASGGIGGECAKLLASLGANLIISGTNTQKLEELKSQIINESANSRNSHSGRVESGDSASGSTLESTSGSTSGSTLGSQSTSSLNWVYGPISESSIRIKPCDLSNPEETAKLIDEEERLDILVCNAGITKDGLAMRMSDEDFDKVIAINLKSSFILNRSAIKKMISARYGRIINISSVVGVSGNPGQVNYCASKAGLIGMSKSLAIEVASRNITVNCIAPGFIETNMTAKLNEDQVNTIKSRIPMKSLGSPMDIASSVAFLASDQAKYITGHTLHVNGGMYIV